MRKFALPEETALLDCLIRGRFRRAFSPHDDSRRLSHVGRNEQLRVCLGWVSDRTGYRYDAVDPLSGLNWPPMPEPFWNSRRMRPKKLDLRISSRTPA